MVHVCHSIRAFGLSMLVSSNQAVLTHIFGVKCLLLRCLVGNAIGIGQCCTLTAAADLQLGVSGLAMVDTDPHPYVHAACRHLHASG
jgi:hypothetical protein